MEITYLLLQIVVALLAIFIYYWYRNLTYWKRRGIPYDEPHIIFGNMKEFQKTKNLHQIIHDYYQKFKVEKKEPAPPFFGFYFLQKPTVFVLDLELVKNILIKDFSNFSDKSLFYNERDDPLSAHLFSLNGEKWRQLRQKMSSVFTSGKMKFMFPTVVGVGNEFIDVLHEEVQKTNVLEVKDLAGRYTTDVIGTCAFGIQCNSLRDPNAEFRKMGVMAFTTRRHGALIDAFMVSFVDLARKLRFRRVHEDVHQFFMRIVHETVALREQNNIHRNDFMDLLIELKNKKAITLDNGKVCTGLTMNEVAAEAFVFFLAGFETSSSTMSFALYELAKHQDVQDKLRTEINEALKRHNNNFTYECMGELHYLKQVMKETLRLYTLVAHLDRQALNRYTVPGHPEYVIEAGMPILIPATAIHRDPDIYDEPDEFRPERFDATNDKPDSVTFLSFGDGPRNCIGKRFGQMQTYIGLALLIKNFKFLTCEATAKELCFDPEGRVLQTESGIYLRLEKI